MTDATYTLRGIESMLGVSRGVITGLIASGFVTPTRGRRREYRFSFQDVVLLRTAYALQAAQIPARRIVRSLQRLKASLPSELPLSGLRITAVGGDVAVRQGEHQWDAESGQLLIDFEVKPGSSNVQFLAPQPASVADDAQAWFERAAALEAKQPARAEQAYREAIARAPRFVDAYLNLGVLLGDTGRAADAARLYRQAIAHCPNEPLLHFNLGVVLEDLQQPAAALASYQSSIALSPALADAHFNAARLHEALGHAAQAIRHYSEYRRLQR